jgi:PAS domain S-box-containing protein
MPPSALGSSVARRYLTALGLVAATMLLRYALTPIVGPAYFRFLLQFIAVLLSARYLGFGPAVAGMALASAPAVYLALRSGRDSSRFLISLAVAWVFTLLLVWLLDHQRRMRSEVEVSARLADERLRLLGAERSQREKEEEYSAQLRAIVESSEDAIISKNMNGVIQSWNYGAEEIFGYTADEAIGKSISLLVPPDRSHEESEIIETIRRGGRFKHFETIRVCKDGRRIEVSLTVSPIRDGAGKVIGVSHVARDISERKMFEEQMRQAQKLESLGVLAGGLAHDFNNLLTGVLGNASLALDDLAHHPARAQVEEIVGAAERAAMLVKQMLAYAGKGRFVLERLDLSHVVSEMAPLIRASIGPATLLDLRLTADLPCVEADAAQLQQLVMNLALNAAEAVGNSNGRVRISTAAREADGELQVVLEVSDTGCGMDEETKARIFDPFFTTKFTGRGLGLAAVLGIIRAHRGSITVDSTPGSGSTFTVVLPAAETLESAEAHDAPAELRGYGSILVIDDEELVRNMTRYSLQRFGYAVETASDRRHAVEVFGSRPHDFDAVLLDLTMPHNNGEDTLRDLREIRPNVPIILSGGYSEMEAERRFADSGVAGFLQKPYTATTLARKLKQAVRERSEGG